MVSSLWHRTRSALTQSSTWSRDCLTLVTEIWPLSVAQRRDRILELAAPRRSEIDLTSSSLTTLNSTGTIPHVDAASAVDVPVLEKSAAPSYIENGSAKRQFSNGRFESNQAALTLVRWEKEVNLLRYYGVMGYLREKRLLQLPPLSIWRSSSSVTTITTEPSRTVTDSSESSSAVTTPSSTATTTQSVGKVAFMITASMRAQLLDELQYTSAEIKTLTPLQASLILQHGVRSDQREEQLPRLLQTHNDAEAMQRKQQAEFHRMEEETNRQTTSAAANETTATLSPVSPVVVETDSHLPLTSDSVGTRWYQIVERKATDSDSSEDGEAPVVVAMYLHENEAELGRETHQYLADKRAQRAAANNNESIPRPAATFEIRQVYIK